MFTTKYKYNRVTRRQEDIWFSCVPRILNYALLIDSLSYCQHAQSDEQCCVIFLLIVASCRLADMHEYTNENPPQTHVCVGKGLFVIC